MASDDLTMNGSMGFNSGLGQLIGIGYQNAAFGAAQQEKHNV